MSAAVALPLAFSVEAYEALDAATPQGIKYEYIDGVVYMRAGASLAHERIAADTLIELDQRLRNSDCEVLGSNTQVADLTRDTYVYPDVFVTCGPEMDEKNRLLNPVLIVEVLSDSTELKDRGPKFYAYAALESLREYWLIEQKEPRVVQHCRENEAWVTRIHTGLEATLHSPVFNFDLPLAALYRRVF